MNVAFRFYALLFLVSMKADGFVVQPQTLPSNSTQPQLQRNESKLDAVATDFLNEVVAAIIRNYPTDDQSKFAALFDALLDHGSASNESTLHSNGSSTNDHSDVYVDDASEEDDDDVGYDFTLFSESISMNADTNASSTFGNVTGSASGRLEITIGDDANMRDGENVSNNAVARLLSGITVSIIVLHAFTLTL
ncbi:unnamed protein product [Peronospora destructor]|uniref:Uncharacterized protein n=1 Tax=Peronospora destructor TaxID=86335 RepID=A0AAV0V711_9STRA|nr:unnamed protein product [Peronospora destructor]